MKSLQPNIKPQFPNRAQVKKQKQTTIEHILCFMYDVLNSLFGVEKRDKNILSEMHSLYAGILALPPICNSPAVIPLSTWKDRNAHFRQDPCRRECPCASLTKHYWTPGCVGWAMVYASK